jgi:hypothetical protein
MKKNNYIILFAIFLSFVSLLAFNSCNNKKERMQLLVRTWKAQKIIVEDKDREEFIKYNKKNGFFIDLSNDQINEQINKMNEQTKNDEHISLPTIVFESNGKYSEGSSVCYYKFSNNFESIFLSTEEGKALDTLQIKELTKDKLKLYRHGISTEYRSLN